MKICTKCKTPKELTEFYKNKAYKDGYIGNCKQCRREYVIENKEWVTTQRRKYYTENKEILAIKKKEYYRLNKDIIGIKNKKYVEQNKEKVAERGRKYRGKNKEKIADVKRKYVLKNSELVAMKKKEYYNSEQGKKVANLNRDNTNKLRRLRRATPNGKLEIFCRESLRRIINMIKENKNINTLESLAYSVDELKIHIESLFLDGMSWDNHSFDGWHIDHKIPLSKLIEVHKDKSQKEILNIVNALDNLQPLWATDNISKGDKIL